MVRDIKYVIVIIATIDSILKYIIIYYTAMHIPKIPS